MNSSAAVSGSICGIALPDALRPAGRAGRVVHDSAGGTVFGQTFRLPLLYLFVGTEPGELPGNEAGLFRHVGLFNGRCADVAELFGAEHRFRLGVFEDVRDLGGREVVVDRNQVETGLHAREVELDERRGVGKDRGNGVSLLDAREP